MALAVYPGSFDPITNGHVDVIQRSLRIFEHVTVAIGINDKKKGWIDVHARAELIRKVFDDLGLARGSKGSWSGAQREHAKVNVKVFQGLTVDFCLAVEATAIIRGLRTVSDFDGEFVLGMNNMRLNEEIETVFMLPRPEHHFTSSSSFREIYARDPERARDLVPPVVYDTLIEGKF